MSTPEVPPPPRADAPQDERVPWGFLDALGAFGLAFLLTSIALGGVEVLSQAGVVGENIARAVFLPLSGLVLAVTAYGWLRIRYGPAAMRLIGDRRPRLRDAGIGVLLGGAAWMVIVLTLEVIVQTVMSGDPPTLQEGFRDLAQDPATVPLLALGAVVVAPIAEEVFFRGLLFRGIEARLGLWPGVGMSALVFALVHMDAGADQTANLLVFLVIFPLGMVLAWAFDRFGSLVVPIAAHALFNLVQMGFLLGGG